MNKYNSISVIIVNKNDRGIADTLAALINIASPLTYEIIVVDASSGKLDDIKKIFPIVRWFSFKPILGKRTIAEQRNYGVNKAKGEIIVFIDASCVPSPNWLVNLVSPLINDKERITAGSVFAKTRPSIYDHSRTPLLANIYLDECPAINSAFTRDVFKVIGTFDEKLGFGEDADFTWRARDAGFKILYVPEADITHEWGNHRSEVERAFRYGIGRTRLYKKHTHRWKDLLTKDQTMIAYPVYIIGLPITIVFWPYPLLILIPFLKNIRRQPVKVIENHLFFGFGVLREITRL